MESTACKSIAVSGTLYTSFSLKNVEAESVEYDNVYTSLAPFAFCEMVNASGLLFTTDLFDNEIANGVVGGVAATEDDNNDADADADTGTDTGTDADDDVPDTVVGNKTVAACVAVFGLNVNVCGSDVLLHFTANFVPRFSSSISVASLVSIAVGLFIVLSWILLAIVVGVPFVRVVVWHTGIVVVFDIWIWGATFVVANVFGVAKLSASTKRRESVSGAGMANDVF